MKRQFFNSYELGLISMSYMKGLFPKPKEGQLLIDEGDGNGGFTLYYNDEYYILYCKAVKNAFNSGAFERSNSESDWNNLMYKVLSAEPADNINLHLNEYWLNNRS